MKKSIIFTFIFILLTTLFVNAQANEEIEEPKSYSETAIVMSAEKIEEQMNSVEPIEQTQQVKLEITSGKYKGESFEIINVLSGNYAFDIPVKVGDKVVVVIEELEDYNIQVSIVEYVRKDYIVYLCIVFVILILLVGRMKGLKATITLALTMFAIVKILLPMILKGVNPIPITILIAVGITIITMFIIGGFNSKSIAAIAGTTGGVLTAGLIAYWIGSKVRLTGLGSEEATMLLYIPQGVKFNFRSLLFSGIIIGSLGAVMDIGMSIASAMEEIYKANQDMTRKELFTSGMNVGKDVMGTMTNTLILAYTGSSIPLLLLFMAYETSMIKILNLDMVATEIIRSLAGSIGLILTIPITALVASTLMKSKKNQTDA
ncbi:YibE/F family protein [Lutibacter sp. B2]|nr:YibE/F family protein [Lutibacter sp. B2]